MDGEVLPQVAKLGGMALDLLFPQRCIGCRKEGPLICPDCQGSLPRIMPPVCPLCGRPQSSGTLCPDCVSWQVSIDGIRSPFHFEEVMQQAVRCILTTIRYPLARPLLYREGGQKDAVPPGGIMGKRASCFVIPQPRFCEISVSVSDCDLGRSSLGGSVAS